MGMILTEKVETGITYKIDSLGKAKVFGKLMYKF